MDKTGLESRIFNALAETSKHLYIYMCNMNTNISRWSKSAVDYFGLPDEYMKDAGLIWEKHIHPEDRAHYHQAIREVFYGDARNVELEYRTKDKYGNYVACTGRGIVIKGEDGEPDLFVGTITNHGIPDNVDSATNLYNIYEFMKVMRSICRSEEQSLVLMIGIMRFGYVNDVYGYAFGNKVLQEFGVRLRELVKGKGTVYRMDGAKFAICLQDMDEEKAMQLYLQIQGIARSKVKVEDVHISFSVAGGAMFVDRCKGGEYSVRACVNYAMEKSKEGHHGELVFYENERLHVNREKLELINTIRQSVFNNFRGFYLCYQPLIYAKNREVIGMEALVRWQDEKFGDVMPGNFIPWLEKDTCFFELGNWILMQALRDGSQIVKDHPHFIVNVNVSYTQLERTGYREAVMEILRLTGFPPENLCIELTEQCRNANREQLMEVVEFFKRQGIRIALDDFGTGAASLNLVRELPIDCLKIDRAFISHILTNEPDQIIVDMVIQCAKRMGIYVCIEGVENQEICNYVMQYQADTHQGFYYSVPVKMDDFLKLL